jgi:hypothetical protein
MTPTVLGHLMQKVIVMVVLGWLFVQMAMAEQVMYQWRDSNNVLHVSQLPPANVDYQTIVLGTKNASPTKTAVPPLATKSSTENQQSCTKAKENLRILQQDLPVYIDLEDGRKELLADTKREQQRQLAEKQIGIYCNESVPTKG